MRILACVAVALSMTAAGATINLNTGQAPGTMGSFSDPVWSIASGPSGAGMNTSGAAYILENTYPSGSGKLWNPTGLPATSVANFISSGDCGRDGYAAACPGGDYSFTTTFNVTDLPTARLEFSVAGDNRVEVYLNGGPLLYGQGAMSGSTGWASMSPMQVVTSGFNLGPNTLELRVINAGGYTGGILEGTFTEAPEPATMIVTGTGLALLALLRRKR